jgi:hypothetical protein
MVVQASSCNPTTMAKWIPTMQPSGDAYGRECLSSRRQGLLAAGRPRVMSLLPLVRKPTEILARNGAGQRLLGERCYLPDSNSEQVSADCHVNPLSNPPLIASCPGGAKPTFFQEIDLFSNVTTRLLLIMEPP